MRARRNHRQQNRKQQPCCASVAIPYSKQAARSTLCFTLRWTVEDSSSHLSRSSTASVSRDPRKGRSGGYVSSVGLVRIVLVASAAVHRVLKRSDASCAVRSRLFVQHVSLSQVPSLRSKAVMPFLRSVSVGDRSVAVTYINVTRMVDKLRR